MHGAFRAVGTTPARILLVDDVLTTGATLAAAAEALRAAGATEVHGVAAVRSLPKRRPLRRPGGGCLSSGGLSSGSVVARGCSPVVDASRGRNDPRKATVGG